uniref:Thiopurine S-methyltransferase n=1 Tax=uncultured Bacteroidota bacterium TaxID=152509 RepID=H5SMC0_9BACT|nr:thiopurine S-methyltransferase [uncultured Bacteroidetes bacterium]
MEVSQPGFWEARYQRGETGWDLGGPTPVLVELLRRGAFPVEPPAGVLVPGCGYGHDVLALAQAGYSVVAVDFAREPLAALAKRLPPTARVKLLQRDFFSLTPAEVGPVAALWEYTCYCAIDPTQRESYFCKAAAILPPGGWLVGLFFPLAMGPGYAGGPPFLVELKEVVQLAAKAGFSLQHQEIPTTSHPARQGREALLIFQRLP